MIWIWISIVAIPMAIAICIIGNKSYDENVVIFGIFSIFLAITVFLGFGIGYLSENCKVQTTKYKAQYTRMKNQYDYITNYIDDFSLKGKEAFDEINAYNTKLKIMKEKANSNWRIQNKVVLEFKEFDLSQFYTYNAEY